MPAIRVARPLAFRLSPVPVGSSISVWRWLRPFLSASKIYIYMIIYYMSDLGEVALWYDPCQSSRPKAEASQTVVAGHGLWVPGLDHPPGHGKLRVFWKLQRVPGLPLATDIGFDKCVCELLMEVRGRQ